MTTTNTKNSPPLRGDISLSIFPGVLQPLAKTLEAVPETAAIYNAARNALTALYDALGKMSDASKAVYTAIPADAEKNGPSGRENELRAAMHERFGQATQVADHNLATMTAGRDRIAAAIENAITDPSAKTPAGISMATEVRAHIKTLRKDKRRLALDDAINEGDLQVIGALLSAKPFLSALSRAEHDLLRQRAVAKFAPNESKLLYAAERAIGVVETAIALSAEGFGKLLPPSPKASKVTQADMALELLRTGKAA